MGGVDGLANIRWVIEQRVEVVPVGLPAFADVRVFVIPSLGKVIERLLGLFGCCRLINALEIGGDRLVVFPRHKLH